MRAQESTQEGTDEKWREALNTLIMIRTMWRPTKNSVESLLVQRAHTLDFMETQKLREVS